MRIRRQLLTDVTQLQQVGELAAMFHDVNGVWLTIFGSVCLRLAPWGQTPYIFCGVVDQMSVSDILGAFFMDI